MVGYKAFGWCHFTFQKAERKNEESYRKWTIIFLVRDSNCHSFTFSPILIRFVTGSAEEEVAHMASLYLKVNASLYFLPALICIFRNSMQGFGDNKTPLVSSLIELAGKVLIAWFLAPVIGY